METVGLLQGEALADRCTMIGKTRVVVVGVAKAHGVERTYVSAGEGNPLGAGPKGSVVVDGGITWGRVEAADVFYGCSDG